MSLLYYILKRRDDWICLCCLNGVCCALIDFLRAFIDAKVSLTIVVDGALSVSKLPTSLSRTFDRVKICRNVMKNLQSTDGRCNNGNLLLPVLVLQAVLDALNAYTQTARGKDIL